MLNLLAENESYLHILTSPAHLLAEITVEIVQAAILIPLGRIVFRRWLKKHDLTVHHSTNEGR